jgi:hypothetical protein
MVSHLEGEAAMRQWLVNPKLLCRKHLLGEHVEHHMFVGSINKGKSIQGHISKGQVEPLTLKERHDQLAAEMERRDYNHQSPLPEYIWDNEEEGEIDIQKNITELSNRCEECRKRI